MKSIARGTHKSISWRNYLTPIWIAVLLLASVATTAYDFVRLGYPWKWFLQPWSDLTLLLCFFSDAFLASGLWVMVTHIRKINSRQKAMARQELIASSETVWPPSPTKP